MDAIKTLKPNLILVVLETTGGAGSDALLNWLSSSVDNYKDFKCNIDFGWIGNVDDYDYSKVPKYKVLESSFRNMGQFVYRYIILIKQSEYQLNYNCKHKVDLTQEGDSENGKDDCIIQ